MNRKLEKLIEELRRMPPIEQVGSYKRYRVIARALDKKGRVLATRTNSYTHTHPVQKGFAIRAGRPQGEFLHAEISCLLASRAEVHTLLIARISKDGIPVPAKPCEICTLAIMEYGVKEIIHT
ncbi:CMP/dCMP-type deaminase domain-containing protein [Escherichia phage ph0011]|nr:CMP/dCMP-type deaminase domain-containing protein [Escherichia phage ph0011]